MSHLSESAVATLRLLARVSRLPVTVERVEAIRELAEAGIVDDSGGQYQFTPWGLEHRDAILAREWDRIERERHAPPDGNLSDAARELLRRIVVGRVEVVEGDRPAFRELAADRVITFGSSFAGGPESAYRFTYWGWHRRFELAGVPAEVA